MTNEFPPRRIWLQGDGDDDQTTWANHETGENDVETAYVRADVADEALAALKIVLQHGRIDDSESRMNQVAAAIAKLEAS